MPNNETPQSANNSEPPDGKNPGDGWWRPHVFEARADNLVRRADMIRKLRAFFEDRQYVEVETPALQVCPGMEPHLSAFATSLGEPHGSRRDMFLHTSPEFAMKKLMVAGMRRIFQLARVFRDGERSAKHHPEFTMLEWYRAGEEWRGLAGEAAELVRHVCGETARRGDIVCDLGAPWEYLSVEEAFARWTGIGLLATAPDPLAPDTESLRFAADGIGVRTDEEDSWDDIFFRIFLERIEPHLGDGAPTVLHSYPLSMAALARPSPEDGRVADRFEIFICGLELANGYGELTDPVEQRRRFDVEIARRKALGRDAYPVDEEFFDALDEGLPACSGIALGFDRLVMLATGAERIEDVLWAPVAGSD